MRKSKLILGTANLTSKYGVSNPNIMSYADAHGLVTTAIQNGITNFDTAPIYGGSEQFLGKILPKFKKIQVDSKLSTKQDPTLEATLEGIRTTIRLTGQKKLNRVYVHDSSLLLDGNNHGIINGLREAKDLELICSYGASVYDLKEIIKLHEKFPDLMTYQVPENICDRRLYFSNTLEELAKSGIDIVVRSILLQGLLVMNLEDIPDSLYETKKVLANFNDFAKESCISKLDLCVAYADSIEWASSIIIGAFSEKQLIQILDSNTKLPTNWQEKIGTIPSPYIDPRNWQSD